MPRFLQRSPLFAGAWALGFNVYDITQVQHKIHSAQVQAAGLTGSIGTGLIISTVAAALVVASAVVMRGSLRELVRAAAAGLHSGSLGFPTTR